MRGGDLSLWSKGATVGLKQAAAVSVVGRPSRMRSSIAPVGDLDGDGTDDILLGSERNNQNAPIIGNAGKVYLFTGSQLMTAAPGSVLDASWASAAWLGESFFDNAGRRVETAGDVDADGRPDLLVSAPDDDQGGGIPEEGDDGAGKVYLLEPHG